MKFKFFLLLIFSYQLSIAQLSELTLSVMDQLNIAEADCEGLFVEMKLPYSTDETVIVIPKIGEFDEDYYSLDSYVALVNNNTNEKKSLFFESYETSGWQSDAIFVYDITIDTSAYVIDKNTRAFGVVLNKRSMSQPNPYYERSISLFVSSGKALNNILKKYPIYESVGETDTNCYGKFEIENRKLSISKESTNGFFDITSIITYKTIIFEEEDGECEDKITKKNTKEHTLTYENGKYKH